jgi:hypothetical protein
LFSYFLWTFVISPPKPVYVFYSIILFSIFLSQAYKGGQRACFAGTDHKDDTVFDHWLLQLNVDPPWN